MDEPLPLPPLLRAAPRSIADLARTPLASEHGTIHAFDLQSGRAESCPAFSGIRIYPEALSRNEAEAILHELEQNPFAPAQSGKWKQHAGAKINFNKRKMKLENFHGLPSAAKQLEHLARRLIQSDQNCPTECIAAFEAFTTTDFFALRYFEAEGSNLDFHRDDRFGYGEAILDISLDSDSVLTFIRPRSADQGAVPVDASAPSALPLPPAPKSKPAPPAGPIDCIRVPLPARSVAVLYGPARFEWEHAILPYDIRGTRTSITLRTLSEALRQTEDGRKLLEIAAASL